MMDRYITIKLPNEFSSYSFAAPGLPFSDLFGFGRSGTYVNKPVFYLIHHNLDLRATPTFPAQSAFVNKYV